MDFLILCGHIFNKEWKGFVTFDMIIKVCQLIEMLLAIAIYTNLLCSFVLHTKMTKFIFYHEILLI